MSEIDSKFERYKNDSRIPCRYGDKCYQKNSDHLSKYKHPPKNSKRKHFGNVYPKKRPRLNETSEQKVKQVADSTKQNDELLLSKDDSDIDLPQVPHKKEYISSSGSESEDQILNQGQTSSCQSNNQLNAFENKGDGGMKKDVFNKPCTTEKEGILEEQKKIHPSQTTDINKPFNPETFIKTRFLVNLPKDFYDFWEFCKELKPNCPSDALKEVGLQLVGPYDVLANKFKHVKIAAEDYLRHWRYYYDPPEVVTVLKGDNTTGYHIGYFYDSPKEAPPFLVSNHGIKDGVFTKLGDNIFAAVSSSLEELKKVGDPFKKMHVVKFLSSIKNRAEKLQLNISLHSDQIKEREKKVVAKTFNKIGLVVPYNKKTQLGYRDLAMVDKELMTLLTKIDKAAPEQKSKFLSDLQPVLTYANIALDECDFGTGVKLGWELLYHGTDCLNSTIAQFLSNSYNLLNKEAFSKITQAHMSKRTKGCDLSII